MASTVLLDAVALGIHETQIELRVGVCVFGARAQFFQQLCPGTRRAILCDPGCVTNADGEGYEQATEDCGPHGGVLLGLPILSYGLLVSACLGRWQGFAGRIRP